MAGAYAALVSLIHVLNRVQHPACPVSFDKSQIRSLSDKVNSLVGFLEVDSHKTSQDLESAMVDAAFAAEDRIEFYLVDRILKRSTGSEEEEGSYILVSQELDKAIQTMELIMQDAMEVNVKDDGEIMDALPKSSPQLSSSVSPSETVNMVGFDDDREQLTMQVTSQSTHIQIIPIVGMGGIGKTTLARYVYDHPRIRDLFDIRAWATVSQDYTVGGIISTLLQSMGRFHENDRLGNAELGLIIYKSLYGRRYLIILDDIWDIVAFERIRRYLPFNNNGSRILITTRHYDVALAIGTYRPHEMQLLDENKSWDLLSAKVFGHSTCPLEFEYFGKKIARSCKGNPLAINVISGLLRTAGLTLEYWEQVLSNISNILSGEGDDSSMKILSLSYHQLPIHLKPCFLYMATFPEDHEIRASEVIRLWVADGLVKPNLHIPLEEVALEYLNVLINRNLLLVKKRDSTGKIKCLILHDLLRDFCIREAQKERFLYVAEGVADFPETIESQRRLVADSVPHGIQQKQFARSFIRFGTWGLLPHITWLNLVRVFVSSHPRHTLDDIMQLVNVRFLKFAMNEYMLMFLNLSRNDHPLSLFSSISFLWNLETLIVDIAEKAPEGYSLPCEIWKLRHIKHLVFSKEVILPDPPTSDTDFVFENLQTLKIIRILSGDVLARIPNIKKLGICYEQKGSTELSPWFGPLVQCHKLEALAISSVFTTRDLKWNMFPDSLRKLTLCNCRIPWGSMEVIGSLCNLEVLKIGWTAFVGKEWESTEGEFLRLNFLLVEECDLVSWLVEEFTHFPCLKHLRLRRMWWLEEIPMTLGETLVSIQLEDCTKSAVISAKQILEEQQSFGKDGLSVQVVHFLNSKKDITELEMQLEMELKQELESMTNDSFQVTFKHRD